MTDANQVNDVIDKIGLRIDDLRENLDQYQRNIDLTLKEIPQTIDIRSYNNSHFNISSSRYNQDNGSMEPPAVASMAGSRLDRAIAAQLESPIHAHATNLSEMEKMQKSGGGANMSNIFSENLSERTLKTILNLQSERAQTQQ